MSALRILILETDSRLTQLTINSIQTNLPRAAYSVVKCGDSKVGTALQVCGELTIVVTSGVILNFKYGDIPPIEKLSQYHIAVSRAGVFADHPNLQNSYGLIGSNIGKGHIDLSIFIINPSKWIEIPNTDARILNEKKVLYMPRYFNHKTDVLIPECVGAYQALKYGMQGEDAAVINYVPNIISGKATVFETYAYCFDKLEDYLSDVDEEIKENILKLSNLTKTRISKLRKKLLNLQKSQKSPR